jgi:hypothetical protein
MSGRTHAALWTAAVVAALVVVPLESTPQVPGSFEARTQALLARSDPRIAAAALARARALTSRWDDGSADSATRKTRGRDASFGLMSSWRPAWRIVTLRLAWLGCAAAMWLPVVVAGAIDGLAMGRARRSRHAPVSPLARAAGIHAVIALVFAPVLWAALPLDAEPLALAAWALATAAALSFTLSRMNGIGAP